MRSGGRAALSARALMRRAATWVNCRSQTPRSQTPCSHEATVGRHNQDRCAIRARSASVGQGLKRPTTGMPARSTTCPAACVYRIPKLTTLCSKMGPSNPTLLAPRGTGVAHNPGNGYKVTAGFRWPNEEAKMMQATRERRCGTPRLSF
jgi:hypothetical protein